VACSRFFLFRTILRRAEILTDVQLVEIPYGGAAAFSRIQASIRAVHELLHPGLGHAGDGEYHHRFAGASDREGRVLPATLVAHALSTRWEIRARRRC